MSEQQKLPGLGQKTAQEWVTKWISDNDLHGQDAMEVRKSAFALMPGGLRPSADDLQFQWFMKTFQKAAVGSGHRIQTLRIKDEDGKVKRKRRYADPVQLAFEDVYPMWIGRVALSRQIEQSVKDEIKTYVAANPEIDKTYGEIIKDLRRDAKAA